MTDRYSKQILFPGIGPEGQAKLGRSLAVIVGCGALGSVIASSLVRAGVGGVRIIDRDFIELHNLQRQILFDEEDIRSGLPKAVAARAHLQKVNSSVVVEGIVADVDFTNVEELVRGADVILDGLDNFEGRFLINDVSLKLGIPWVYGGAVASCGMLMTIIPHETACFQCISGDEPEVGTSWTCDVAGVVGPAPFVVGALQAAEALKIIVGSNEVSRDLTILDVWNESLQRVKVSRRENCRACRGEYRSLEGKRELKTARLCGQDAVQVSSPGKKEVSLEDLAGRLGRLGKVSFNEYMLRFEVDGHLIVVFPDGRAIIKNTTDKSIARGLYAKYLGT